MSERPLGFDSGGRAGRPNGGNRAGGACGEVDHYSGRNGDRGAAVGRVELGDKSRWRQISGRPRPAHSGSRLGGSAARHEGHRPGVEAQPAGRGRQPGLAVTLSTLLAGGRLYELHTSTVRVAPQAEPARPAVKTTLKDIALTSEMRLRFRLERPMMVAGGAGGE